MDRSKKSQWKMISGKVNIFYNFETLKKSLNDLFGHYTIADKRRTKKF